MCVVIEAVTRLLHAILYGVETIDKTNLDTLRTVALMFTVSRRRISLADTFEDLVE
jgi:hypothetical protein